MGGQEVDEGNRTDAEAAAVLADKGVEGQALGGRLPHPLGVLFGLGEEGRVARRGRRARTDASERGHGRAHVSYGVVEAVLVAERQIRSVVGKEHHLLGLKGPVQTRHGGQHGVHVLDVVVPARAELGAAWAAQGVVANEVNLWGHAPKTSIYRFNEQKWHTNRLIKGWGGSVT